MPSGSNRELSSFKKDLKGCTYGRNSFRCCPLLLTALFPLVNPEAPVVTCSRPAQGQGSQLSRIRRGSHGPSLTEELLADGHNWGSILQFPFYHCDKHHDQTQLRAYLSYPSISQSITEGRKGRNSSRNFRNPGARLLAGLPIGLLS